METLPSSYIRPKVSVIIPVYQVEKYIADSLCSVLNQTLKELEIIIIDDGSLDNSWNIISEYAKKDSRIIAIQKSNGGYGSACNVGLEKANGEYIAIFEPDDFIDKNMYADLYKIAKMYNSDIVKSGFYRNFSPSKLGEIEKEIWNDEIPENKSFTIKEYPYFLSYHPSIWTCIYKRDFIKEYNIKFVEASGSAWTDNLFQVQTMCLARSINMTRKAYYYWRCKRFDSDMLKDYKIPFLRSEEIYEWLERNNITDAGILLQLYKRAVVYVILVLGMKYIKDKKDCYARIENLLKRYPDGDFLASKFVNEKHKNFYKIIRRSPSIARFKILMSRLRKKLFSIQLRTGRIVLFGIYFTLRLRKTREGK